MQFKTLLNTQPFNFTVYSVSNSTMAVHRSWVSAVYNKDIVSPQPQLNY